MLDLEAAVGHSLGNLGLSHQSDVETTAAEEVGGVSVTHVDFSLSDEMTEKILKYDSFTKSKKHKGWIQHIYAITDEDIKEFRRRRGYALSDNQLVWLEYRLPFIGAWVLLFSGVTLYGAWLLFPESWLGQLVPLMSLPVSLDSN